MSVYGFWQGPQYRSASPDELMRSALDQPMSGGATFFDQAKGGILESFGLGSAIRDIATPSGNDEPQPTGNGYVDTVRGLDDLISPRNLFKRLAGTLDRSQPTMTEDSWKSSAYFRQDIPYDPAMTEARAASLADWYDHKKAREFYAQKRPITAFFGNLAGQALDPINYIPVAGPLVKAAAVARFGKLGGAVVSGSLDAAANTAAFGVATAGVREQYGDDVSWQTTVSEIATAALIGGAFGALGRGVEARLEARANERLSTLRTTQEARIALNEAIDGLARDGEVRLGPNSIDPLGRVATEVDELGRAYDAVHDSPTGPIRDPLVEITPEDIEGTIVARGAFRDINETEFSKRGWGLVKMIWRHGEESRESPEFQIRKEDIIDLPNVVRDYEPSSISNDGRQREWRVERNGRTVVYADTEFGGRRHTVTAYVQKPDAPGADLPLSEKRSPAAAGSPDEPLKPVGDTALRSLPSTEGGQPLAPAERNIARPIAIDNSPPRPIAMPEGRQAAEARVAKVEDYKTLAEQYRVDPETGDFPELAEIENLRAQGRLSDDDAQLLDGLREDAENGKAYGEALKSVVNCLL